MRKILHVRSSLTALIVAITLLWTIEETLNYPIKLNDKLMALGGTVLSADAAPTKQSYEVFEELSKQLDEQLAKWRAVLSKDVAALNDSMRKENLGPVLIAPVKHDED